ncbi:hypothetical protein BKA62DRAFT_757018 [Auriculariales sp. MPI-PUGE-AT-0066]|nr:hypothetical protein BKA62DRAFT_757018 [Auriculariales sp. MPI-PUGE-AT-0066]
MSTETTISNAPVPKAAAEDGSISWTAKTSANGVAYEVGVRNAAPSKAATAGDESYDVDWPVTGDNWVETKGDIHNRITYYRLKENTFSIWSWRLDISNVADGDYYFTDSDVKPDTYHIACFDTSQHYVRFNSPAPTIKKVVYKP